MKTLLAIPLFTLGMIVLCLMGPGFMDLRLGFLVMAISGGCAYLVCRSNFGIKEPYHLMRRLSLIGLILLCGAQPLGIFAKRQHVAWLQWTKDLESSILRKGLSEAEVLDVLKQGGQTKSISLRKEGDRVFFDIRPHYPYRIFSEFTVLIIKNDKQGKLETARIQTYF